MRQRHTRQRAAIIGALEGSPHPCTPEELLTAAQRLVAGIGMATVYRAIRDLCDEGRLQTVALPGAAPRYELAGRGHHHHFECHGCHRVFDVEGCAHDLARLAPAGFTLEAHEIVLYGRCPDCAATAQSA